MQSLPFSTETIPCLTGQCLPQGLGAVSWLEFILHLLLMSFSLMIRLQTICRTQLSNEIFETNSLYFESYCILQGKYAFNFACSLQV